MTEVYSGCRNTVSVSLSKNSTSFTVYEANSQSCISRCRPGHPLFAGHQGHAQRDASHRRQASDSVRRRRSHRSEEHTSELQSLMRTYDAVLCFKTKKHTTTKY